jgi:tetratricopeptide (TPR) repeat protein
MHSTSVPKPQAMEVQVWDFMKQGKPKEAVACCEQLNRTYPDFAGGWRTTSHLAERLKNPEMALRAIDRAVTLEPENTEWKLQKGKCLMSLGRVQTARPLLLKLAQAPLANAYQYASLGLLLSRLELHEQALEKYREACRLEPEESQHYYNLATLYRFLGLFDEAEASLAQALALNPAEYDAYKLRADMRRQTPGSNHVQELSALIEAGIEDVRGRVDVLHAMAKELEDLEEYDRSWVYLKRGADTRRKLIRYDVSGDTETMARIRDVYQAPMFDGSIAGNANRQAIFVLGMPRTGTTLVERILASHSQVYAAGELNNFAVQLTRQARLADQAPASKMTLVDSSARLDFAELGRAYIESTCPATAERSRFIDKMPLNFLYAGLIHLALPNARILHLRRHPLDTCYAIFKTLFTDAYPFSYDLQELGRYYLAYDALMQHWTTVMPGVIQTVNYEDLVANVEEESRRLLAGCGLPWEQQCLSFYENAQASTTASASQVRQPVYTSSVGKWRHFEKQLQPLITTLEQGGLVLNG